MASRDRLTWTARLGDVVRTPLDLLVDPVERRIIERNVLRLDVTGLDEAAAYQQLVSHHLEPVTVTLRR